MANMFRNSTFSLIYVGDKWTTEGVDTTDMFRNCSISTTTYKK